MTSLLSRFIPAVCMCLAVAVAACAADEFDALNPFDENYPMGLEYRLESRGSFFVIGKLGQGTAANRSEWLPPLWQEASKNAKDIASEISLTPEGSPYGIWAIMSDLDEKFLPWHPQNGGKYLAGFEANSGTPAPQGWTKWQVPGYRYVVARFPISEYDKVFALTLNAYIPSIGQKLVGAVHERYPDPSDPKLIELYFPIEKIAQ